MISDSISSTSLSLSSHHAADIPTFKCTSATSDEQQQVTSSLTTFSNAISESEKPPLTIPPPPKDACIKRIRRKLQTEEEKASSCRDILDIENCGSSKSSEVDVDDGDGKVVVSAQWTVSLANAVKGIENELELALEDAAAAGRKRAAMEEAAEAQVCTLRQRLEEKIHDILLLELELENAQDILKEKEKDFKVAKHELNTKIQAEMECIRNERTCLIVKLNTLEEENAALTAKLLDGNRKKNQARATSWCFGLERLSTLVDKVERRCKKFMISRNKGVKL